MGGGGGGGGNRHLCIPLTGSRGRLSPDHPRATLCNWGCWERPPTVPPLDTACALNHVCIQHTSPVHVPYRQAPVGAPLWLPRPVRRVLAPFPIPGPQMFAL